MGVQVLRLLGIKVVYLFKFPGGVVLKCGDLLIC